MEPLLTPPATLVSLPEVALYPVGPRDRSRFEDRCRSADWLIATGYKLSLGDDVVQLAIAIMDRSLEGREFSTQKIIYTAVASLVLASKVLHDDGPVEIATSFTVFDPRKIRDRVNEILVERNFKLLEPWPLLYLPTLCPTGRHLAHYLIEVSLLTGTHLSRHPRDLALAAANLAQRTLGLHTDTTPEFLTRALDTQKILELTSVIRKFKEDDKHLVSTLDIPRA